MSNEYLHRDDAPFEDDVWHSIDGAVVGAARGQLTARRLLHVEGPHGLGFKALPGADKVIEGATVEDVEVMAPEALPVALIRTGFCLGRRDVAAFEQRGVPLELGAVAEAAVECAEREDDILFNGSEHVGVSGLLNTPGSQTHKLQEWGEPGVAADDVIAAATALDNAGFHGPYALALAPDRYNLLFRRYDRGNQTEIEHLRQLVTEGIIKAPAIAGGGVLIASGRQFASILLGQDLMAGFIGPADGCYEFDLSETVALRLVQPGAVCVLK
jgi:uncharacterized linocin/CFP29 family protein